MKDNNSGKTKTPCGVTGVLLYFLVIKRLLARLLLRLKGLQAFYFSLGGLYNLFLAIYLFACSECEIYKIKNLMYSILKYCTQYVFSFGKLYPSFLVKQFPNLALSINDFIYPLSPFSLLSNLYPFIGEIHRSRIKLPVSFPVGSYFKLCYHFVFKERSTRSTSIIANHPLQNLKNVVFNFKRIKQRYTKVLKMKMLDTIKYNPFGRNLTTNGLITLFP